MKPAEIGVVVWKEQPFHSDAVARAFAFERMKQAGPVTWFYNKTYSKSFEEHQSFQQIRYPQWPVGEIVQEEDFESLKFKLEELEGFAKKYPNAAGYLKGVIGSMRDAVSKYSSGNVFFNGTWITRAEHEKLVAQRDEVIKKYKLEREELERKLQKEVEAKLKLKMATDTQQRSTLILVVLGVWLFLVMIAGITKSWGAISILMVILAVVAGWFTYAESGFGWTEHVVRAVKDMPSLWPFTK